MIIAYASLLFVLKKGLVFCQKFISTCSYQQRCAPQMARTNCPVRAISPVIYENALTRHIIQFQFLTVIDRSLYACKTECCNLLMLIAR